MQRSVQDTRYPYIPDTLCAWAGEDMVSRVHILHRRQYQRDVRGSGGAKLGSGHSR